MTASAPTLRAATPADAAVLARFRAAMFTDMGVAVEAGAEACWAAYFTDALASGPYRAQLAEVNGQVVAGAGLLVFPAVPTPRDPSARRAHILGVYTLPACRGQGLAAALTLALLRAAKAEGIGSANLNASAQGYGVYERLGFTPARQPELRLNLHEVTL
ncbi:GNAT family N-acetyltransferase [Deinococcus taeanensis]|uniref:GNAT family N-acetyltransferase n=1 Tax=Deinococcus taeanensis TaxID=2737050 RepID=UPI001CDBED7A|nr:GNAT family N-acetyltransferase [Deinococcus taeanensis]UBV42402.1 GNAT family N-acetyltransferase [Deinococcus taeanensis]